MTLKELKNLGRLLTSFLGLFADCFASLAGRQLLKLYIKGQLSDIQRKGVSEGHSMLLRRGDIEKSSESRSFNTRAAAD
ncbi:MAG TPA: hypothetical protein VMM76_22850 [Pirellulaceae bacterium]|nr:hypothetical protein [Pirellulaceae bacterium]